jgi:hypothetical protein
MNLSEGYRIMLCYLNSYYWRSKLDELGGLLGSMSLLSDNTPADYAFEENWKIAVSQIVEEKNSCTLSSDNIYKAMIALLHNWADLGSDGTIYEVCVYLEKTSPQDEDWQKAVDTVMVGNDEPYLNIMNT